jgi:hypothetical protein
VPGLISASFFCFTRKNRQIIHPLSPGVNHHFITYSGKQGGLSRIKLENVSPKFDNFGLLTWLTHFRPFGACHELMDEALNRVQKTLPPSAPDFLSYFDHRITSGAIERLINKIKTLKRQA